MNELKTKLEQEDKDYLVATILDLQNMVDHQRRQLINKDKTVERFRDSNIIYEDTLKEVRNAIIDMIRDITLGNITTVPEFVNHLEQLKDAI